MDIILLAACFVNVFSFFATVASWEPFGIRYSKYIWCLLAWLSCGIVFMR